MANMKKSYRIVLALVLITLFAGIVLFISKPTQPLATEDSEKTLSESSDSVIKSDVGPVKKELQGEAVAVGIKAGGGKDSGSKKAVATSAPEKMYFEAEKFLFVDRGDAKGMNVKTVTSLIKGNNFDNFMDSLAKESSGSTLALDITNLYSLSAQNANQGVDNAVNYRVVCGLVVCGISANSPTKDVFDAWFMEFVKSKAAPPYASGRYDFVNDNGMVEYRIVFSSDSQRNRSIMQK